MTRHFCDKCDKESVTFSGRFTVENLMPTIRFELCTKCFMEFGKDIKQEENVKAYIGLLKPGWIK